MTQMNTDDGAGSPGCLPSIWTRRSKWARMVRHARHHGTYTPGVGAGTPLVWLSPHRTLIGTTGSTSRAVYFRWEIADADRSNEMTDVPSPTCHKGKSPILGGDPEEGPKLLLIPGEHLLPCLRGLACPCGRIAGKLRSEEGSGLR